MKLLLLILIILTISLYLIYTNIYDDDNLILVQSTLDNSSYWVRDINNKSEAANTLAAIKINMIKLINHLNKNIETFPNYYNYIKDLVKRTKIIYIYETPKDDKYTSYTINKGEKIVFCLRSKIFEKIHDMNTLMYVVIHEMAHVGCPEYGHTPLFKKIFKFLLKEAINIQIYKPVDYRINPQKYCGMIINEYIL